MINAKKQRKTIEWERIDISSTKLGLPRFHAKITIKDRNGMDVTEAEDTRRDDKNTQKNYIKRS